MEMSFNRKIVPTEKKKFFSFDSLFAFFLIVPRTICPIMGAWMVYYEDKMHNHVEESL